MFYHVHFPLYILKNIMSRIEASHTYLDKNNFAIMQSNTDKTKQGIYFDR